jgi:hypothetical protein
VKYRRDLNHLLLRLRLWPIDLKTAQIFGDVYTELYRGGRVLSQVDLMVAAMVRQMKLTILTTDRDFEAIPDFRTDDWSTRKGFGVPKMRCGSLSGAVFAAKTWPAELLPHYFGSEKEGRSRS